MTFSDFSNYKKSPQVPIDNGITCFFVFSSVSRNYITIFTVIFLHNALPSNELSTYVFYIYSAYFLLSILKWLMHVSIFLYSYPLS